MLKKWHSKIADPNMDISERIFRLISTFGIIALIVTIFFGLLIEENPEALILLVVALVLMSIVSFFSLKYKKMDLGADIVACFIIFIILPVTFFTTGGMYGGTPAWFVFCAVYICMSVRGRLMAAFLVIEAIMAMICYSIAWTAPELIVKRSLKTAYLDSFSGVIIVSFLVCMLIVFQRLLYRQENEKVRQKQAQVEEMSRAQNLFFSSMSHEIRTPINSIIGLNEMILREDISDEVADDARNIQGASKMLLTIINDLLDVSKLESGKMEIVPVRYNVGNMLSEIVAMIWLRAKEKGLEFRVDIDPSIPVVLYGDEVRIKQVIINLLNNAVKYTSEGGVTLSLRAKNDGQNRIVLIIAVADTGMGIKRDSIPRLFDAFTRADEDKNRYIEGTGLGLSIVKQLVDLMDGDIFVNSVYTKGSTFTVNLPQGVVDSSELGEINLDKIHSLHEREHYRQSFEAPEAKLLIVDDNEVNLKVEAKLLRDTKIKVDTATSGNECLALSLVKKYDIIFMDHLMPEMDGIECLNALRSQQGGLNRETPVIVLTANAGGDNRALYEKSGFNDYLTKPVSGIDMEQLLVRMLPKELVNLTDMSLIEGDEQGVVSEHKTWVPVRITTDSVSDLPNYIIEEYNIPILSYRVHTDHGVFLDNIELETEEMLTYLDDPCALARSTSPTVKDYEKFFASQLSDARNIIHISMARGVSSGYKNAKEAAASFDNVTVIDSGQLSSGQGLLVMYAAKLSSEDIPVDELVSRIKEKSKRIKTSFVVDSTSYLARSGRISSKADGLCKVLMLHPMICMRKNKMKVGTVITGYKDAMRRKYIHKVLKHYGKIDDETIFITYAGLNADELEYITEQVKRKINVKKIIYQKASSAISINCGPGSFGIIYSEK